MASKARELQPFTAMVRILAKPFDNPLDYTGVNKQNSTVAGGQEAYCIAGRGLGGRIAFLARIEAAPSYKESLDSRALSICTAGKVNMARPSQACLRTHAPVMEYFCMHYIAYRASISVQHHTSEKRRTGTIVSWYSEGA